MAMDRALVLAIGSGVVAVACFSYVLIKLVAD